MREEYLSKEFQALLDRHTFVQDRVRGSLSLGLTELAGIYKEHFPFQEVPKTGNNKSFIWSREFVYKALWAMATDDLGDMGHAELDWWLRFVEHQEKMSFSLTNSKHEAGHYINHGLSIVNHGVMVGTPVIGCTLQDVHGKSYEILKGTTRLGSECRREWISHQHVREMESLDELFMDMLNDVPNNREKEPTGELIDITNSIYDNIKDVKDVSN